MSAEKVIEKKEVAFAPGFLTTPLSPRDKVRLVGTKCRDCGTVLLGPQGSCGSCASTNVEAIPLSREGKIWSYTVMRYTPPWPFATPNPHQPPIPVAWVQLPEGVQFVSQIECAPEELKIDMPVEMVLYNGWQDEQGNDAIMYRFRPVKKAGRK